MTSARSPGSRTGSPQPRLPPPHRRATSSRERPVAWEAAAVAPDRRTTPRPTRPWPERARPLRPGRARRRQARHPRCRPPRNHPHRPHLTQQPPPGWQCRQRSPRRAPDRRPAPDYAAPSARPGSRRSRAPPVWPPSGCSPARLPPPGSGRIRPGRPHRSRRSRPRRTGAGMASGR